MYIIFIYQSKIYYHIAKTPIYSKQKKTCLQLVGWKTSTINLNASKILPKISYENLACG